MFDRTIDLNPAVFRPLENRPERGRVFRIRQRTECNADHRRQGVGLPVDRRPAVRTKVAADLSPARPIARKFFWRAGNANGVGRIKRADAKWRAGPSLTVETMTGDNQLGWSWQRQRNGAATALGISHYGILCFSTQAPNPDSLPPLCFREVTMWYCSPALVRSPVPLEPGALTQTGKPVAQGESRANPPGIERGCQPMATIAVPAG